MSVLENQNNMKFQIKMHDFRNGHIIFDIQILSHVGAMIFHPETFI